MVVDGSEGEVVFVATVAVAVFVVVVEDEDVDVVVAVVDTTTTATAVMLWSSMRMEMRTWTPVMVARTVEVEVVIDDEKDRRTTHAVRGRYVHDLNLLKMIFGGETLGRSIKVVSLCVAHSFDLYLNDDRAVCRVRRIHGMSRLKQC